MVKNLLSSLVHCKEEARKEAARQRTHDAVNMKEDTLGGKRAAGYSARRKSTQRRLGLQSVYPRMVLFFC